MTLQVYKSTGDVESARKMYSYYSDVNDQESPKFLSLRSIIMDRKQPRKLFVQHHTYVEGKFKVILFCEILGWFHYGVIQHDAQQISSFLQNSL